MLSHSLWLHQCACLLQVLLDLSCGSGLFTRRFVSSNKFKGVIGADFSESMLQHTKQLFNQDQMLDSRYASALEVHEMKQ